MKESLLYPIGLGLIGLLLILGPVQLYLVHDLLKYLRKSHTKEWEKIGRPTLLTNSGFRTQLSVLSKLRNRSFDQLRDAELASKAHLLWAYIRVLMTIIGIGFITIVALILSKS